MLTRLLHNFTTSTLPIYSKIFKQINQLTKFKLSLLNGLVTTASYTMYATQVSCIPLLLSSVALSMSTQALNQYIEIQYDKKMVRTSQRPLVLGMNKNKALMAGISLGIMGLCGLSYYNTGTAVIGMVIWSGYLFIYTTMKSKSECNTFVGSIVGSLPVYLGWMASGRSICMAQPFGLFLYMMAWQHQHFYGIRWIYYDDYNNAGFKMQKSKSYASSIVVLQTVMSIFMVNYSLRYFDVTNCYLFGIPITLALYYWGIKASVDFSQGKISPKQLKMASYKHFLVVFLVFILCSMLDGRKQKINISKRKQLHSSSQFPDILL